jgi:hypothetical protein
MAAFLRAGTVPTYHVVYENMVREPERVLGEVFSFLGVPNEPQAVEYGREQPVEKGLGDPIGVKKHSRPTTESIDKWAIEIAARPDRVSLCREIIARLDPEDLETWGYPLATLWEPLEKAAGSGSKPTTAKWNRYRLERMLIVRLRSLVGRSALLRRWLSTIRLAADVLLRE